MLYESARLEVLDRLDRDEWDRLAAWADGGHPCQTYEWGDFLSLQGEKVYRLALGSKGEPVATMLMVRLRRRIAGKWVFYTPWGPVLRWWDEGILAPMCDELKEFIRSEKALLIRVGPAATDSSKIGALLHQAGFRRPDLPIPCSEQHSHALVVDLRRSEEELLSAVKPKWAYNLRLAERRGVVVEKADADGLPWLVRLMDERSGGRTNRRYIPNLWEAFSPQKMVHLFLARHGKDVAAAALCITCGAMCWLWENAVSLAHRSLMPNHLLQWRVIMWARDHGYHAYHMGAAAPPNSSDAHPLAGATRFKEGFGAQLVEYPGQFDLTLSPLLYRMCAALSSAANRARERLSPGERAHR
jgi:lipid II:glycine glycyltransferase (peptidoglycan interpeptide bridge formation enzyme)